MHEVVAVGGVSGGREPTDLVGRPHSSIKSNLRRLHAQQSYLRSSILIRHLRHTHAPKQALEAVNMFECLARDAAKFPEVARQSSFH